MKIIDTTQRDLKDKSILIHGDNNTGKTTLLGAALSYERAAGKCVYLHLEGEPSISSVLAHDLDGVLVVTIEKLEDIPALLKEYGRFRVIGLDSLLILEEMAEAKQTGGLRAPGDVKKGDGVDGQAEWGRIKFEIRRVIELLKKSSDLFIAVGPSDKTTNIVTGEKTITPDLLGKLASRIMGRFDFVGYMEARSLTPTTVRRTIDFSARPDVKTRCNAASPITKAIAIPDIIKASDKIAGWLLVRDALTAALKG